MKKNGISGPGTLSALWLLVALTIGIGGNVHAATYYADPVNGDPQNPGTMELPWKTLAEVFSVHTVFDPGDTLYLLSGHHGDVTVTGLNEDYVTILPLEGHQPTMRRVNFNGASKWVLRGVEISPETAPSYSKSTLVSINSSSSWITVDSCLAYSVADASGWSASDWVNLTCNGASVTGNHNILRNNHFLNVRHGILVESEGTYNLIERNTVENFAADGMRGIGNYNTFEYNTVMNCYDVDDNHDDGFQSYSRGPSGVGTGTVYGIVLRGNTIINYVDPDQPFRGTLQGVGCFDGMFEDWVVENNVVITDHWHGITLLGARNCKVINNTVVDRNSTGPGPPWISIAAHKDGTLGTGNAVRNNLTTSMDNDAGIGSVEFNMIVSNYDLYFVDYDGFDLRLIEGCPAIDAGTDEGAPLTDRDGNPRPQGAGFDIGAYEYPSGPDTIAPLLVSIISIKPGEVEVLFNERMDEPSASDAANYTIEPGIEIVGASLGSDRKTVCLTVQELEEGIGYQLTVEGVKDISGNAIEQATMAFEHVCGYVTASTAQEPNYPENTLDGDLGTRWSAEGVQWIKYDLCTMHTFSSVEIAFYYGNTRSSNFKLEVSADDSTWLEVFSGASSGTTTELESFDLAGVRGRYLKITGSGNSNNDWNSYTEVVIHAEELVIQASDLGELIDQALQLHDNAVEGSGPGEYPPGSKALLMEAISHAQAVLDDETSKPADLSLAYVLLEQAMAAFEAGMNTGTAVPGHPRLEVYPNPFSGQIHFVVPGGPGVNEMWLTGSGGRTWRYPLHAGRNAVSTRELPPGIYLARVFAGNEILTAKIVKMQ